MKISNTSADKIGELIRKDKKPKYDTLMRLLEWRSQFVLLLAQSVQSVEKVVGEFDVVSGRIKNSGTIIDKLESSKTRLSQMIDIAGIRIVMESSDLSRQDQLVANIKNAKLFEVCDVYDIRDPGHFGYRAVHLRVKKDGQRIEIQIRTKYQHRWAEMYERLADVVGRQIKYGFAPTLAEVDVNGQKVSSEEIIAQASDLALRVSEAEGSIDRPWPETLKEELLAFREILECVGDARKIQIIKIEPEPCYFHLIIYDRMEAVVSEYITGSMEHVQRAWIREERDVKSFARREIVLIFSRSAKNIEVTHERYFNSYPGTS